MHFLSVFLVGFFIKFCHFGICRNLEGDNGSDSGSLKWSDSESDDDVDENDDGISTTALRSQSGAPSPAKKERKIEIEIEDILCVHCTPLISLYVVPSDHIE